MLTKGEIKGLKHAAEQSGWRVQEAPSLGALVISRNVPLIVITIYLNNNETSGENDYYMRPINGLAVEKRNVSVTELHQLMEKYPVK